MSTIERALNTPEAYQAIGRGIVTLLFTKNIDVAIEAMLDEGRNNGSLAAVQTAVVIDSLTELGKWLNVK